MSCRSSRPHRERGGGRTAFLSFSLVRETAGGEHRPRIAANAGELLDAGRRSHEHQLIAESEVVDRVNLLARIHMMSLRRPRTGNPLAVLA